MCLAVQELLAEKLMVVEGCAQPALFVLLVLPVPLVNALPVRKIAMMGSVIVLRILIVVRPAHLIVPLLTRAILQVSVFLVFQIVMMVSVIRQPILILIIVLPMIVLLVLEHVWGMIV